MPSGVRRHKRLDYELPGLTGKIPAKNLIGVQRRPRTTPKRS
jgi:hypothetical protein